MKKRIFLTLILMFAGLAVLYCQPTNSDLSDALASLGISGGLATVIVTVLAVLVGKFIPQKWADPLAIIIKFAKVLIVALEWLNDKINKGNDKQEENYAIKKVTEKVTIKKAISKAWLIIGIVSLFLFIPAIIQAQPTKGFFKPVTSENFMLMKGEGKTIDILIKPTVDVSGTETYIANKEIITKQLIGAGVGVSALHYKDVTTNPYNDWGVNVVALFNATEAGNVTVSPLISFSYQKFSLGAMYDMADKHIAVVTALTFKFNL